MTSITKNTLTNSQRLRWFQATLALSFVVSIFFARQLFWNIHRSYPLAPLLQGLRAASWLDIVLTALLIAALVMAALSRKSKPYLIAAVVITAFLFLEDQNRLFPSFYEYFLLLFVLAWYAWKGEDDDRAGRILTICRVAVAFVYFWSGAQKVTPFFESQMSWVLAPLTNAVPLLQGGFIHWVSLIAPFIEMEIGIGLLFKKTRTFALIEALLMHGMLFLFIGPLRDPLHESAWIWNVASACMTFILFFNAKTEEFSFRDKETRLPRAVVFLALGVLPLLSFVNLWDSSLSFNIFSGNVAYVHIDASSSTLQQLPYHLDINRWAENEFGAEPSPEPRVLKNIVEALCATAGNSADIQLTIYDKLKIFQSPASRNIEHYNCL